MATQVDVKTENGGARHGFDPSRLPMDLPIDPERTFTASELIRAADNDAVRLALSFAKGAFPGDVWGAGAEGEYAWLAGVAALLGTPEIAGDIAHARQRENWSRERHGEDAKRITGRVPRRILKEFGLSAYLRRAREKAR